MMPEDVARPNGGGTPPLRPGTNLASSLGTRRSQLWRLTEPERRGKAMAKFQITVVLEVPDKKPEYPDSLGFLPKNALEKMGEDVLTDREEYVSASIVAFEKLG
jgi:hypothetical protein